MLIYLRRLCWFEEDLRMLKVVLQVKLVVPYACHFLLPREMLLYLLRICRFEEQVLPLKISL